MNESKIKLIMLVDDSSANLLVGKAALSENYRVQTAGSAELMFDALEWSKPDLILLDVDMPGMSGFDAIKILKGLPETRDIPVIFLTGLNDSSSELMGLETGAVDYIRKPFTAQLLLKRVELHLLLKQQRDELQNYNENLHHMVEEKTNTIAQLKYSFIEAMAEAIESRDSITGNHVTRTRQLLHIFLTAIVESSQFTTDAAGWDIDLISRSSQLHDIGKISVSDSILKHPGKLSPESYAEMQKHVAHGVTFLENLKKADDEENDYLHYAQIFAAYHHEKWDGSGYPHKLAGENIPLLGRVMAIIDVYDALTSERPYKNAFTHEVAMNIIHEEKGRHFDPTLVDLFTQIADQFEVL